MSSLPGTPPFTESIVSGISDLLPHPDRTVRDLARGIWLNFTNNQKEGNNNNNNASNFDLKAYVLGANLPPMCCGVDDSLLCTWIERGIVPVDEALRSKCERVGSGRMLHVLSEEGLGGKGMERARVRGGGVEGGVERFRGRESFCWPTSSTKSNSVKF